MLCVLRLYVHEFNNVRSSVATVLAVWVRLLPAIS
jgi:hypothetical protein